jgi:hypothetical protein
MKLLPKLTWKMLLSSYLIGQILKIATSITTSENCKFHLCVMQFIIFLVYDSSRNVVKAFYSAGMLFDVCAVFGELNEDVAQQKKWVLNND